MPIRERELFIYLIASLLIPFASRSTIDVLLQTRKIVTALKTVFHGRTTKTPRLGSQSPEYLNIYFYRLISFVP